MRTLFLIGFFCLLSFIGCSQLEKPQKPLYKPGDHVQDRLGRKHEYIVLYSYEKVLEGTKVLKYECRQKEGYGTEDKFEVELEPFIPPESKRKAEKDG